MDSKKGPLQVLFCIIFSVLLILSISSDCGKQTRPLFSSLAPSRNPRSATGGHALPSLEEDFHLIFTENRAACGIAPADAPRGFDRDDVSSTGKKMIGLSRSLCLHQKPNGFVGTK